MGTALAILSLSLLAARAHYWNQTRKPCDFCCYRQTYLCKECENRLRPEGLPGVTRRG